MKRMILIVTIALLPVLSACFIGRRTHYNCPETAYLVPEVSEYGTLKNLKDDKGKRLFKKPIQEGFSVRYRVGDSEEYTFYAIGDRISYSSASYSGYRKEISGAGITTRNGLNITSGFVLDKNYGTLRVIRTIVNRSEKKATMYLGEVKNYSDPNLRPLRTIIGVAKKVEPLPPLEPLPPVIGAPEKALTLRAEIDAETTPTNSTPNCWPCLPWPDCDLLNLALDPTKATIVCISCKEDVPGLVHTVCLADLEEELAKYKANGCDHPIKLTGISDTRAAFDKPCPPLSLAVARYISGQSTPETGQDLSEEALKQLSPTVAKYISREVTPETGKGLSEEALKQLLTLRAEAAIVIITEHKINLSGK